MAVRRKSNWYIYAVAFLIATALALMAIVMFRWYLFPSETTSVGLDATGELSDDFKPSSENNFASVIMISDYEDDSPEIFVVAMYSAVENRMTFVPLPNGISVGSDGRDLSNIYTAQGGAAVISTLNGILGINCTSYLKIDRDGFIELVSNIGNVQYDVAKTIIIKDGTFSETVNAGTQRLTAETIFRLMMVADFDEGESYRFNIVGSLLSDLINQNFRTLDSLRLDTLYWSLDGISDNNITDELYKNSKAAMLYTVEYGSYPAEYYVPYGEYDSNGSFTISENSLITIQQKAE